MQQIDNGMQRKALFIKPLDVLFFRDNKSFSASNLASGSGQPFPQTLYGALFTKLLSNYDPSIFSKWGVAFSNNEGNLSNTIQALGLPEWFAHLYQRGPWLSKKEDNRIKLYLRTPATLLQADNTENYQQLKPLQKTPPGWQENHNPLWCKTTDVLKGVGGYITLEGMKCFLNGKAITKDHFLSDKLYKDDIRTGIEIDSSSNTSKEGQIYRASFLSLANGVGYYSELVFQEGVKIEQFLPNDTLLHWGGEGKAVSIEWVDAVDWSTDTTNAERTFYVLITPGIFAEGWKPDGTPTDPIAAKVPGYEAVSGWNYVTNAPKPTRFAVPAGAVYFYEKQTNSLNHNSLCACEDDIKQGWGLAMKGNWNYA